MTLSVSPQSVTLTNPGDIADLVRDCASRNVPIADYGVAHQGVGNPPPAEHVKLTLTGGIIEHYERDLTVRAHAGIKLCALNKALKPTGQFVPLDADDDLTLGEIINHHVYGGLRAGYGSIRDLLLGLHYIDGEGRDIHVGGRTVKNVAGLDVTRLMVGSLGELGIIHEATLRTYAAPEQTLTVDIGVADPGAIDALLPRWVTSDASPAWMVLEGKAGAWAVRVGYFGRPIATSAQQRSLEGLLKDSPALRITGSNAGPLDRTLTDLAARRAWQRGTSALAKIVVPSALTGSTARALAESNGDLTIHAMPVHGCLFIGGDLSADATRRLEDAVGKAISPDGFRVWHARPQGCEDLAPFAPLPADLPMMKRLKQAMDPRNLFNRGRLIPVTEGIAS